MSLACRRAWSARDLTALAEDVVARRLLAIQGGRAAASVVGRHAAADRHQLDPTA
jgi:hypothetical protein